MTGSMNRVTLLGHLGREPDVRSTQDGKEIANLSVATSESWKDKSSGERIDKTQWHRVVIFNEGLVGVAKRYLRKGSRLLVEGQLQTRKWTDQAGVERYSTEVVLSGFSSNLVLLGYPSGDEGESQAEPETARPSAYTEMDDEIAF